LTIESCIIIITYLLRLHADTEKGSMVYISVFKWTSKSFGQNAGSCYLISRTLHSNSLSSKYGRWVHSEYDSLYIFSPMWFHSIGQSFVYFFGIYHERIRYTLIVELWRRRRFSRWTTTICRFRRSAVTCKLFSGWV
jgi:hypothetical protein